MTLTEKVLSRVSKHKMSIAQLFAFYDSNPAVNLDQALVWAGLTSRTQLEELRGEQNP